MRHFLFQSLRHYLLALQFFTRIPVTGRVAQWVGFSPAMLRASAGHFPGVGWLVGALLAGFTAWLMGSLAPGVFVPLVAAALGTALGVLLTGAFHEDGLADVADGLGGTQDRERALLIMKDSRVGAFGAIAVVLALLCKVALLALLGGVSAAWLCTALFLGHVVSRTWPLLLIRWLVHVGDAAGSKSKPLADQISRRSLFAAFIWCFSALALIGYAQVATEFIVSEAEQAVVWQAVLGGLVASAMAFGLMWRWFWQRLQGFTGDCLGTTQQVCELAFYLGLALSL
jgi:adenosylcobinamide-GDP ribazoletransferase